MLEQPNIFVALVIIIMWGICVWFATVKYLAAYRAKKRLDKIIWFIVWCLLITMIEWMVYFGFALTCAVAGVGCMN